MDKTRVSIAQVKLSQFEQSAKENKLMDYAREAKEDKNADLLLFPELYSPGYIIPRNREFGLEYYHAVEEIPGRLTDFLCQTASRYGLYLIVGMGRRHSNLPGVMYNSAVLVGPGGELIGVQDKIHIPGYEKQYFEAGVEVQAFETEIGRIGMGICYDNQFPEYTRLLTLDGCTIICMLWCMPNYGSHPSSFLQSITATRAVENRCYALSCNPVGSVSNQTEDQFVGGSCASDPVGNILVAGSSTEEELLTVEIDHNLVIQERVYQPVFNDRRPDLYQALMSKARTK